MKIELLTPKFNFELHLLNNESVICRAEAYEINSDGSITFYQHAILNDDKKVKLSVLSHSKWSHCILLHNGDYPVYNDVNNFEETVAEETITNNSNNNYQENSPFKENEQNSNDMNFFNDFDMSSNEQSHSSNSQQNENEEDDDEESKANKIKIAKKEFLQDQIKEYVKKNNFNLQSFNKAISNYPIYDKLQVTEFDIIWEASKLILDKVVMARRFNNPELQKEFGLVLPSIMKRQWNGTMSPILEVLSDLEPTKNATQIDLAVWMVNNNWNY